MTVRPVAGIAVALLLLLITTGCGGSEDGTDPPVTDSSPSPTTTVTTSAPHYTTAQDIERVISEHAAEWLDGFSDPADQTFVCNGSRSNAVVVTSDHQVRACLLLAAGNAFTLHVQNLTDVPMSIWGNPATNVFTVQPGQYADVPLLNVQFGQTLSYQTNSVAGLTAVVTEHVLGELQERRFGKGLGYVQCAADPDAGCVLGSLTELLPQRVRIGEFTVPLRTLSEGLVLAYDNRDLLSSFAGDATGQGPQTMQIQRG